MSLYDDLFSAGQASGEVRGAVFFDNGTGEGYEVKEQFKERLLRFKNQNRSMLYAYRKLFNNFNAELKLAELPELTHSEGVEGCWLVFRQGKILQKLWLEKEGGMFEFVTDYALGRLNRVKCFADLMKELED